MSLYRVNNEDYQHTTIHREKQNEQTTESIIVLLQRTNIWIVLVVVEMRQSSADILGCLV